MNKKIPRGLYKQILENMPVFCVDAIVHNDKKILLIKRKNEPAKNKWWIPGGRVHKNERLEEAVKRKVLEETGLKVKIEKQIGLYEYFSKKGPFSDLKTGVHNPVIVYSVKVKANKKIELDETSSDYKWIDKIENDLHNYVKVALKDSGIF